MAAAGKVDGHTGQPACSAVPGAQQRPLLAEGQKLAPLLDRLLQEQGYQLVAGLCPVCHRLSAQRLRPRRGPPRGAHLPGRAFLCSSGRGTCEVCSQSCSRAEESGYQSSGSGARRPGDCNAAPSWMPCAGLADRVKLCGLPVAAQGRWSCCLCAGWQCVSAIGGGWAHCSCLSKGCLQVQKFAAV